MSLYDYRAGMDLAAADPPFYSLIMAAMVRADMMNAARLRAAFPQTWIELDARYDAPGGVLPQDGLPQDGGA
jgi:hypothetical protein